MTAAASRMDDLVPSCREPSGFLAGFLKYPWKPVDGKSGSSSSTPHAAPGLRKDFRLVARQPILNRDQQVFGYELLFHDGMENFFVRRTWNRPPASLSTLRGQRAFINCTRELLGLRFAPPARLWWRCGRA